MFSKKEKKQLVNSFDLLHHHMRIDPGNDTHVTVENAGANGAAVTLFPDDIIIVPDLHDPVSFPEGKFAELAFLLIGSLGI